MRTWRADLHIHSVLSPCGNLDMSPSNIVRRALEEHLDIIGITDHNSTLNGPITQKIGEAEGLLVLLGTEVTTREEVHCLTFFENTEKLHEFQQYLETNLPTIPNDPDRFGYQLVVNEKEEIIKEEKNLLLNALHQSLEQIEAKVHKLDGILIPAHVDRKRFSILSQLGLIPKGLKIDGLEFMNYPVTMDTELLLNGYQSLPRLSSSDAHHPYQIGEHYTLIRMWEKSFQGLKEALQNRYNFIPEVR